MSSSAPAVKAALVSVCAELYPSPALVSYGNPGTYRPDDIVAVTGQRTRNDVATMGTSRTREETVETVVIFSAYRAGDETQQQAATEGAYSMLDVLVDYLRTRPNETLGGACREARVTEHELDEALATHPNNPSVVTGRLATIAAVVTSATRV